MATIKTGWLKDFLGNKFAPKTSISAVLDDNTGTSYKNTVNTELDKKVNKTDIIDIAHGGTNATTAPGAQTNLGLDELLYAKTDISHKNLKNLSNSILNNLITCGATGETYYFLTPNKTITAILNGSTTTNSFSLSYSSLDILKCGNCFIAATRTYRTVDSGWFDDIYYTFTLYKSTNGYTWTRKWYKEYPKGNYGSYSHQPTLYYNNGTIRMIGIDGSGKVITVSSTDMGENWTAATPNVGAIGDDGNIYLGGFNGNNILVPFDDNNGYFYSVDGGTSWEQATETITGVHNIENLFYALNRWWYFTSDKLYTATSSGAAFNSIVLTSEDGSVLPTITRYTQIFESNDGDSFFINNGNNWLKFTPYFDAETPYVGYRTVQHDLHKLGYISIYCKTDNIMIFQNTTNNTTYVLKNNIIQNATNSGNLYTLKNIVKTNEIQSVLKAPSIITGTYLGNGQYDLSQGYNEIIFPPNFNASLIFISSNDNSYQDGVFMVKGSFQQERLICWYDYLKNSFCISRSDPDATAIEPYNKAGTPYFYIAIGTYEGTNLEEFLTHPINIIVDGVKTNAVISKNNIQWKDFLGTNSTLRKNGQKYFTYEGFYINDDKIYYNNAVLTNSSDSAVLIYDIVNPNENYTTTL